MYHAGLRKSENKLFALWYLSIALVFADLGFSQLVGQGEIDFSFAYSVALFTVPLGVHFLHEVTELQSWNLLTRLLYLSSTLLLIYILAQYEALKGVYHHFGLFPRQGFAFNLLIILGFLSMTYGWFQLKRMRLEHNDRFVLLKINSLFIALNLQIGLLVGNVVCAALKLEFVPTNYSFIPLAVAAYGMLAHIRDHHYAFKRPKLVAGVVKVGIVMGYLCMIPLTYWALNDLRYSDFQNINHWNWISWELIGALIMPYGLPPLISWLVCIFLTSMALQLGKNQTYSLLFSLICLLYSFLSLEALLNIIIVDAQVALNVSRFCHFFLSFLFGFTLHLIFLVTGRKTNCWQVWAGYLLSVVLAPLTQTPWYFQGMNNYYWGFYPQYNIGLTFALFCWAAICVYSSYLLYRAYIDAEIALYRNQYQTWFSAIVLILLMGMMSFPALMGKDIYPAWTFIFVPFSMIGYALFRHNLSGAMHGFHRSVYYLGMLGLLVIVAGQLEKALPSQWNQTVFIVFLILAILGYKLVQQGWNALLKLFFAERESTLQKALQSFQNSLKKAHHHRDLHEQLSTLLFKTLHCRRFALLVDSGSPEGYVGWESWNPNQGLLSRKGLFSFESQPLHIAADHPILGILRKYPMSITRANLNELMVVNDIALPPEDRFLQARLIRPVSEDERMICLMLLDDKTDGTIYTHEEREFLRKVTQHATPFIRNALMLKSLEDQVAERTLDMTSAQDRLWLIHVITKEVSSTLKLDEVCQAFIHRLMKAVRPKGTGMVLLHERRSDQLVCQGLYGLDEPTQPFSFGIGPDSMDTFDAYFTRQSDVFVLGPNSNYQHEVATCILPAMEFAEVMVIPLVVQDDFLGLFILSHFEEQNQLTLAEKRMLEHLGRNLANHLENVLLYLETQQNQHEISQINQVMQKVNATLDVDEVMKMVIEALKKIFKFDVIAVHLVDPFHEVLIQHKIYGDFITKHHKQRFRNIRVGLNDNDSLLDAVIFSRQYLYLPEIEAGLTVFHADNEIHELFPFQSVIFFPLEVQYDVIGCISFYSIGEPFELSREDIHRIQRYLPQVAAAVHNASLYEEVQEQQNQIQLANAEITHINEVIQKVNTTLDLDEILKAVKEALQSVFQFDQLGIGLVDVEDGCIRFERYIAEFYSEEIGPALKNLRISLKEPSFIADVVRMNKYQYFPVIKEEVLELMFPPDQKLHSIFQSQAALFCPLTVQQQCVGLIAFGNSRTAYDLGKEQIAKIERYVTQIAIAINNARLSANLRKSLDNTLMKEKEIEHLNEVIHKVNSTLNLEEVLDVFIKTLQSVFSFDLVSIQLVNQEQQTLNLHSAYGQFLVPEHLRAWKRLKISLKDPNSMVVKVIKTQIPLYLPRFARNKIKHELDLHTHEIVPFHSMLVLPLVFQNEVIGCIGFYNMTQYFSFTYEDIKKLQRYVTQISNAIHNAHLYETSMEMQNELSRINQVVKALNSSLDLDKLMDAVMKALQSIFRFDQIVIAIINEEEKQLEYVKFYGESVSQQQIEALKQVKMPLDTPSHFMRTVLENRYVYLPRVTVELLELMHPIDEELYGIFKAKAYLFCPLEVQGKVIGSINFGNTKQNLFITEDDFKKIELYIPQIAIAVNNAQLSGEMRQLLEASRQKEQEIGHINQVLQMVNATLDPDKIIVTIKQVLQEIFAFDQVGIWLVDAANNRLTLQKAYGEGLSNDVVKKIAAIELEMVDTGSFFVNTVLNDEPSYVSPITPELEAMFEARDMQVHSEVKSKAYLFFPLKVHQQIIGEVVFGNSQDYFELDEAIIHKIHRYVDQIATAINNARLYEDLKSTRVQLAETEKIARMTRTFEKFVPRQFINRVAREGIENIRLGEAQSDVLTVLFSDIRSFTSLSEQMTPQELLNFLNSYFKRMSDVVHEHHGFVDKFIGDAMMAIFDRKQDDVAVEAQDAVQAAVDMQRAVRLYNTHRKNSGYKPISIGIGIHSGPAIIGTVGAENRMDSTVLGDSVNIASRLEELTKSYGVDIIISSHTFSLLPNPERFYKRELDWLQIRGKSKPIEIYEIFDSSLPEQLERKAATSDYFTQGLYLRKQQKWDKAIQAFQTALTLYQNDRSAQYHIAECQRLSQLKLPEDWDGATDMSL